MRVIHAQRTDLRAVLVTILEKFDDPSVRRISLEAASSDAIIMRLTLAARMQHQGTWVFQPDRIDERAILLNIESALKALKDEGTVKKLGSHLFVGWLFTHCRIANVDKYFPKIPLSVPRLARLVTLVMSAEDTPMPLSAALREI